MISEGAYKVVLSCDCDYCKDRTGGPVLLEAYGSDRSYAIGLAKSLAWTLEDSKCIAPGHYDGGLWQEVLPITGRQHDPPPAN